LSRSEGSVPSALPLVAVQATVPVGGIDTWMVSPPLPPSAAAIGATTSATASVTKAISEPLRKCDM
jgi:hypothetical protein